MVSVQREAFDVGAEYARLVGGLEGRVGGVAMFVGLVRDFSEGGGGDFASGEGDFASGEGDFASGERVRRMVLEHYPGMAEKELERLVGEARERWELLGCVVAHRYGALELGEPIVLVGCAAAHRKPALEACAFLIDWLKTRAPFWKLEETEDGRKSWVSAP